MSAWLPLALAVGLVAGLAISLAPEGLAGAFALFGIVVLPASVALSARARDAESRTLLALFLAAILARLTVALVLAYAAPSQFFALDDQKYMHLGLELAAHWAGQGPYPDLIYGRPGYYAWNALLFTLLGEAPLAPVLVNVALGGFTSLLAYGVAREIGGPRAGLLAAGLAAFWPSLMLWQSLNLKDAWVILGLLATLHGAQRLGRQIGVSAVIELVFGLAALSALRGYLSWIAGAAVLLAWLLPRFRTSPVVSVALIGVATIAIVQLLPIQDLTREASFESLDRARHGLAYGSSAYLPEVDISTPGGALSFLPQGLAIFLLAPLPWQLFGTRQILTLPEMLVWYALLPLVVLGLREGLRDRFRAAAAPAIFAGFATVSYALVEGNLGTAYRHRAQVILCFLIFAAVALARRLPVVGFARGSPALAPRLEVRT